MIEAAMIWNEPNNKSHWDPELDPGWARFAETAIAAGRAIREAHPTLPRVLGGMSPIDPAFIRNMEGRGVLEHLDADERVEGALELGGDLAVVEEVHADAAREARRGDALLRELLLLDGERQRVDLAPERPCGLCNSALGHPPGR